ncbi:insulin-like growth factor-binding protein-related protein 1 [Phymastichus coffea]|uniref:insulin-like growth factor-binding protein-related protein 1 n=1 Tax=Phymastichus coffea TaxID=108790 RepID=UPI00273C338A|nr:insulin-like growth factor-binding protein-related protein 1 [Phymastichus coffea]
MTCQRSITIALLLVVCYCCCANAHRTTSPPRFYDDDESFATTEQIYAEGCHVCGDYRCPSDPKECLLGSVPDTCGCCSNGVCARLDGESCWNASISELPKGRRTEGLCARNYVCKLRDDLESEDQPEAICVCMEQSLACASNNRTYPTPCALHEEAMRNKDSNLRLQHLGPCPSRPSIYSAPEDFIAGEGQLIALNCEVKGFPLPDVFWEFHAADNNRVLRLPNDEWEDGAVNTSEDPESTIRSSWLQLERLDKRHAGTYHCIANNSIGEASAFSTVSIG